MNNLKDLSLPKNPKLEDIFKGPEITPLQRLEIMDPNTFEIITEIWLHSKIGRTYDNVKRNAGSGDKGRDIVAYNKATIDIYQCKHYKSPLNFSVMAIEFLKLCYYTYNKDFKVPKKYFIVSSKGCSTKFRTDYLDKPKKINGYLLAYINTNNFELDNKKLKNIPKFLKYLEKFNFVIVKEITPQTLIEEFWTSKYRPYYFGGGLNNFIKKKIEIPKLVQEEERNYISQLVAIYSEEDNVNYDNHKEINRKYIDHFEMQRTYYYSIETFRRSVRDNLPSLDLFDEIEKIIYEGINDITLNIRLNGFDKLQSSLERSTKMNMDGCTLKSELMPNEKKGVCHRLTNEKKIRWV